ncbi:histidine kinase [Cohnella kolymensis]|uniref:histidine kinase n=1 Tax=Cohnella kolymensis TaxID=1590652 RepID=A0ABR5A9K3_9BACL|nr:ATP-binding protein [Cohnella kolymensis]KIL37092.1 histidine kinase [Cohnella kolymensis]
MSIRVRLVLSYLAMLLVPVVLAVVAVLIFLLVNGSSGDPFKNAFEQEAGIYADMKQMSAREPESLLQRSVAQGFDQRLNEIDMRLIIRVNHDIAYASPYLDRTAWEGRLPQYGTILDQHTQMHGDLWITRHEDFLLPDNKQGSIFVIADMATMQKTFRHYIIWVIVGVLLILALTNGVLTYLVSRSIIRPLRALQRATEEIKEGNLDHQVKPQSKDEIGQLSAAFEEMRKKLKESVRLQLQYEENRKELISNISHDLKTPVTAIKGYVEGIMDGVTNSPDKLDRYLKTIHTKTVDLNRMIDELFLFSKLDLGKVPFNFEKVDIGGYLRDCAQEIHFDMEQKGIKLKLDTVPKGSNIFVKADREKLKRVLTNILENAMKYMDKEDGKIEVGVTFPDGEAVISISDNGQGIEAAALPHIFDRFYRADPSRNSTTGGSGLGLSIARQIVEEHGGRIWADSELGMGTTVYISLPVWSQREGEGAQA